MISSEIARGLGKAAILCCASHIVVPLILEHSNPGKNQLFSSEAPSKILIPPNLDGESLVSHLFPIHITIDWDKLGHKNFQTEPFKKVSYWDILEGIIISMDGGGFRQCSLHPFWEICE